MNRARWIALLAFSSLAAAQQNPPCSCGANPPGPPRDRELRPYAGTPPEIRPFGKFTAPYYENYTKTVEYNGGARDLPVVKPQEIDVVRIGFLGPVENHPDEKLGRLMLN